MKNTWIITKFTLQEAFARKNFITFFAVSTLAILIILAIFASTDLTNYTFVANSAGPSFDLRKEVAKFFRVMVILPLFGGGLFLSIFSVSSFIPNMLEKGNIDVFLSKPISRTELLLGKFFGGILVVFINVLYLVFAIWVMTGAKFASWDSSFLLSVFSITFAFMVLYAMIILIGVLTQSSVLAMMMSYLIFFILSPLLEARKTWGVIVHNDFVKSLIDMLYYIIPKTSEMGTITKELALGNQVQNFQPVFSSFLFMILTLVLGIFIFNKKDY
jgi:ABC-type transport system involved in multi-copper enzyme maturation permease subunit